MIDFPDNPVLNDPFVGPKGQLWKWDGVKWKLSRIVMVGLMVPYSGPMVPEGYLLCDGRPVPRGQYPELYAVIGIAYGAGDGEYSFNLPDCRFRTLVGSGELDTGGYNLTVGQKWGVPHVTLTASQMPAHLHVVSHQHGVDIQHNHYVVTGNHSHGDPSHAHPDPTHQHSMAGGYYNMRWGNTDYSWMPWEAGWFGNTAAAGAGLWGAGVALHNAGDVGGHTVWMSDMAANYHIRSTGEAGQGDTDVRGSDQVHSNIAPALSVNYIIKY